jgi:hypothetical protein
MCRSSQATQPTNPTSVQRPTTATAAFLPIAAIEPGFR